MSAGQTVILIYLFLMAWHAVAGQRATRSVADFHLAGRQVSGLLIGVSFYATFLSTNTFLGLTGRSARWGFTTWFIGLAFLLFAWISWRWIAAALRYESERFQAISLPELLGKRFGSDAYRRATAAVIVVASVPYLQAVFKGSMIVMSELTQLGEFVSLAILWAVVVVYTIAGGFHAVVRTDFVQGFLMLIASLALPLALISNAGGVQPLLDAAVERAGAPAGGVWHMAPWGGVLGISLAGGFKLLAEPRLVSRYFAVNPKEIRLGRRLALATLGVSFFCLLPVGFLALGVLEEPHVDPDRIVPALLGREDLFPPLLGALFLAAFLAAAMSSIDSVLLVVSAALFRDLFLQSRAARRELAGTRLTMVGFSLIPLFLVIANPAEIIELTTFSGGIYGAALLPSLLFCLHGRAALTATPAWVSLALGTSTLLAWKFVAIRLVPQLGFIHEVVAASGVSFLGYLLTARLRR